MSDLQLKTARLVLRRMEMADVPALHRILSDPEAMRYWSTLPHEDSAVTKAWVAGTIASVAAGKANDFAVVQGGDVIGKAGLWNGDEIGVILSRDRWGHGYAAEALSAVIAHTFAEGGVRITADIDPRNTASARLFAKLGFHQTGSAKATFLLAGEWTDSLYLALTPEDWSGR